MLTDPRVAGMLGLLKGLRRPPAGSERIAVAFGAGALCHLVFTMTVFAMMAAMFFGMSRSLGSVPWPEAWIANAFLVLQFPLTHSLLLTGPGRKLLCRLVPGSYGTTLQTTTYAIVASLQLLALFALWTPSGIIWWQAQGSAYWLLCLAYGSSWLMLMKASFDAGVEVQSGALGWMSLVANTRPVFPDMPTRGLFRLVRQPIYVAFALTLWTVPVWTPDQLALAVSLTAYCLLAPRFKERRFKRQFGDRFENYRRQVPYCVPRLKNSADDSSTHCATTLPASRENTRQERQD